MNITNVWAAPSTRSCFKNSAPYIGDTNTFTLDAAKGESVSMQIMIKNGADLKSTEDAVNKAIKISDAVITQLSGTHFDTESIKIQAQEYISFADGIAYPDPISNGMAAEKYDKVKAKELSSSIAAGYTEFTEDEKMLVNARRELLKLAESAVENT